jgi:hypothetical protein
VRYAPYTRLATELASDLIDVEMFSVLPMAFCGKLLAWV